jgi:hypothetical protein
MNLVMGIPDFLHEGNRYKVVELASRLPGKYTFACVWLEGSHTFL